MPLLEIAVATRASRLALVQVEEVRCGLPDVHFKTYAVETTGDRDLETPLVAVEMTDFFTKELDELVLNGVCRIAIHSAKDLAVPLRQGLAVVALTRGLDPRDSLVFFQELPLHARIGVSSLRRTAVVKRLSEEFVCVAVRG